MIKQLNACDESIEMTNHWMAPPDIQHTPQINRHSHADRQERKQADHFATNRQAQKHPG